MPRQTQKDLQIYSKRIISEHIIKITSSIQSTTGKEFAIRSFLLQEPGGVMKGGFSLNSDDYLQDRFFVTSITVQAAMDFIVENVGLNNLFLRLLVQRRFSDLRRVYKGYEHDIPELSAIWAL